MQDALPTTSTSSPFRGHIFPLPGVSTGMASPGRRGPDCSNLVLCLTHTTGTESPPISDIKSRLGPFFGDTGHIKQTRHMCSVLEDWNIVFFLPCGLKAISTGGLQPSGGAGHMISRPKASVEEKAIYRKLAGVRPNNLGFRLDRRCWGSIQRAQRRRASRLPVQETYSKGCGPPATRAVR
jgi:hypothetical protein